MIDWDALVLAPVHALLGEPVTYFPGNAPPLSCMGVFTEKYASASLQDDTDVAGSHPIVNVRASLFADLPCQGELVSVRGVLFQIVNAEPDGLGDLKISLRNATDAAAALRARAPSA